MKHLLEFELDETDEAALVYGKALAPVVPKESDDEYLLRSLQARLTALGAAQLNDSLSALAETYRCLPSASRQIVDTAAAQEMASVKKVGTGARE